MPLSHHWNTFTTWGKKYGPVTFVNIVGKPIIVLNNHEAAVELLDKRASIYSDRPRFVMAGELCGAANLCCYPEMS